MSAADRIRARREELGLSQEELAFKLGYKNRSSVNKVENSRDLSLKKVRQYAEALQCSPAYLMGWEDNNTYVDLPDGKVGKITSVESFLFAAKENEQLANNNGRILIPKDQEGRLKQMITALESMSVLSIEDQDLVIEYIKQKRGTV